MIIVSACLLGQNCTYKGTSNKNYSLCQALKEQEILAVCPEVTGGLDIPRPPAEIMSGQSGQAVLAGSARVCTCNGQDVTEQFIKGAQHTLALAKKYRPNAIILKENSPSCGSCFIHSGKFDGGLIKGSGVTAALLKTNGFKVFNEHNYPFAAKTHGENR